MAAAARNEAAAPGTAEEGEEEVTKVAAEPAEEGRAVQIPLQVFEELVRVAQSGLGKARLAGLLPGL